MKYFFITLKNFVTTGHWESFYPAKVIEFSQSEGQCLYLDRPEISEEIFLRTNQLVPSPGTSDWTPASWQSRRWRGWGRWWSRGWWSPKLRLWDTQARLSSPWLLLHWVVWQQVLFSIHYAIYGREQYIIFNQSEHSILNDLDQWEFTNVILISTWFPRTKETRYFLKRQTLHHCEKSTSPKQEE